jgi:hypothetical protein
VGQVVFKLSVFNGAFFAVKQGDFFGVKVNAHGFIVLRQ